MTRYVLLAGEGPNELGGWYTHPSYRAKHPEPGALETLLRKVAPEGWEIRGAVVWKQLTQYRANDRLPKDELNTRALGLMAREHGCDLIVFTRDRDGSAEREQDVGRGRAWLQARVTDNNLTVIGAVAVECLEAWVLALQGQARTEELSRGRAWDMLERQGLTETRDMVAAIVAAQWAHLPKDAVSLRAWLDQARSAFA
jgi:hypothetical protein